MKKELINNVVEDEELEQVTGGSYHEYVEVFSDEPDPQEKKQ